MVLKETARYGCVIKNKSSYFSTKAYVVGTQKNRLNEIALQERSFFAFKDEWNHIDRH